MTNIAVIGMACEFPGATTPERLWQNILARRRAFRLLPDLPAKTDKLAFTHAALIEGYRFDHVGFHIDTQTFAASDMAHWLALDVATRALEHAGYPSPDAMASLQVGVYMAQYNGQNSAQADLSPRIAKALGLPNATTMSAPTPYSLSATVHACIALAEGRIDMAVVGGAALCPQPTITEAKAATGTTMRIFDKSPTGTLPGEGSGVLVLKRMDAVSPSEKVQAMITGWALNKAHDDGLAQACKLAGVHPRDISYFEADGTGFAAEDELELKRLIEARQGADFAAGIGSVMANLGLTFAAAGVAAMLKAVKTLKHQIIPATTGCLSPHSLLEDSQDILRVIRRGQSWPVDMPLRVCVCGRGVRGTHVILESAEVRRTTPLDATSTRLMAMVPKTEMLALSARTPEALARHLRILAQRVSGVSRSELTDIAAHLASASPELWRVAIMARTVPRAQAGLVQAAEALEAGVTSVTDLDNWVFVGRALEDPHVGFLFSGQSSPVLPDPGFLGGRYPWIQDMYDLHLPEKNAFDAEHAQTAVVLASVAGRRLLHEFGVQAHLTLGHSLGELTALFEAGAMDEKQLFHITRTRAVCMARFGEPGGMVIVNASADKVARPAAQSHTVIACYNGPDQTVISGTLADLDVFARKVAEIGLTASRLKVTHGFHSPLLHGAQAAFAERMSQEVFAKPKEMVYSTVTGNLLEEEPFLMGLLTHQFTAPVRFQQAFTKADAHADLWLEVGPGSVFIRRARKLTNKPALATNIGGGFRSFLSALAAAFVIGVPVNLPKLYEDRFHRSIDLDRRPECLPRSGDLRNEVS